MAGAGEEIALVNDRSEHKMPHPESLERLMEIAPPPRDRAGPTGDWTKVEAALGLRLPEDYKAYVNAYGTGALGGLVIDNPFGFLHEPNKAWTDWAAMYHDFVEYGGIDLPYPVFPESNGLLPFGCLCDVNHLNWLTVGECDQWPFVYYDRDKGFREIPGLSATEFIHWARAACLIRPVNSSPSADLKPLAANA